jgi:hypothetical protein
MISAAVSFGFSVEVYKKAKQQKDEALTNAKYALARSLSLFLTSIGLLIFISNSYLISLSVIMIGVQLLDGIIGIKISIFKTIGPILTSLGNFILLVIFLFNTR